MERRCNICKEWDRHIYWNILEVTKLQFWFPLRGNFTEKYSIPGKFVMNFKEKLGKVIHLKGPSEKTWKVELRNMNGSMFFGGGWEEFVAENLLEEHDLLVFKYDGDSHFKVSIFDKSGCEKESAYFVKQCNHQNIFAGDGKDTNQSEDSIAVLPTMPPEIHECSSTELPHKVAQTEAGQPSHGRPHKRKIAVKKGKKCLRHRSLDVTSDGDSSSSGHTCARKQCHQKQKIKAEADGSFSQPDESKGNPPSSNSTESCSGNGPVKRGELAGSSYASFRSSKRRHVTKVEEKRALEKAMEFRSDNHFFLTVMKPTHVYKGFFMAVPKQFAEDHLHCKKAKIILQTSHSRRGWVVSYRQQKCSSGFGGNWWRFVDDNDLEQGDVCVFELKDSSKDIIMYVHIFRVVKLKR